MPNERNLLNIGRAIARVGQTDGRFSQFFVADILKVALEELYSANFSQLIFHVHC